jgi:hypothetical protein
MSKKRYFHFFLQKKLEKVQFVCPEKGKMDLLNPKDLTSVSFAFLYIKYTDAIWKHLIIKRTNTSDSVQLLVLCGTHKFTVSTNEEELFDLISETIGMSIPKTSEELQIKRISDGGLNDGLNDEELLTFRYPLGGFAKINEPYISKYLRHIYCENVTSSKLNDYLKRYASLSKKTVKRKAEDFVESIFS